MSARAIVSNFKKDLDKFYNINIDAEIRYLARIHKCTPKRVKRILIKNQLVLNRLEK